jgi:hypothetical protein
MTYVLEPAFSSTIVPLALRLAYILNTIRGTALWKELAFSQVTARRIVTMLVYAIKKSFKKGEDYRMVCYISRLVISQLRNEVPTSSFEKAVVKGISFEHIFATVPSSSIGGEIRSARNHPDNIACTSWPVNRANPRGPSSSSKCRLLFPAQALTWPKEVSSSSS